MFEISAKAYCDDHKSNGGPVALHPNGTDRKLALTLEDIYNYMVVLPNGKKNQAKQRRLHGPLNEIVKESSLLSVTSMNALVHNPTYAITTDDLCITFGKIFPLLEALNE